MRYAYYILNYAPRFHCTPDMTIVMYFCYALSNINNNYTLLGKFHQIGIIPFYYFIKYFDIK
jgi:hypothetical protein